MPFRHWMNEMVVASTFLIHLDIIPGTNLDIIPATNLMSTCFHNSMDGIKFHLLLIWIRYPNISLHCLSSIVAGPWAAVCVFQRDLQPRVSDLTTILQGMKKSCGCNNQFSAGIHSSKRKDPLQNGLDYRFISVGCNLKPNGSGMSPPPKKKKIAAV